MWKSKRQIYIYIYIYVCVCVGQPLSHEKKIFFFLLPRIVYLAVSIMDIIEYIFIYIYMYIARWD